MKIGGMQPKVNLTGQKKISQAKGQELPKDNVTLGSSGEDLGIMERPLGDVKSGDINPGVIYAMLGLMGAGGAALAGIGAAGRAFGGVTGLAIAAGSTALVGGFLGGKEGGDIKINKFLKGAAIAGGITAGGGALSAVNLPLALGAGFAGGIGGTFLAAKLD